jgi:hypothetical protein
MIFFMSAVTAYVVRFFQRCLWSSLCNASDSQFLSLLAWPPGNLGYEFLLDLVVQSQTLIDTTSMKKGVTTISKDDTKAVRRRIPWSCPDEANVRRVDTFFILELTLIVNDRTPYSCTTASSRTGVEPMFTDFQSSPSNVNRWCNCQISTESTIRTNANDDKHDHTTDGPQPNPNI